MQRKEEWPHWHLPSPFKKSGFSDAIIYPEWFEGNWQVFSIDVVDSKKSYINHLARFKPDNLERIIADRVFNSESLARQVLGDEFLYVKEDLNTQNRQLAVFKGDKYLESKVVSREYKINSSDTFIADEIVFQIYHSPEITKINEVETLSEYKQCNPSESSIINDTNYWICGEQWQAIYKEPGQNLQSNSIHTSHYQIFFIPLNLNMTSDDFLMYLSNRKVALIEDDL